jgi:hypothetical protein
VEFDDFSRKARLVEKYEMAVDLAVPAERGDGLRHTDFSAGL